MELEDIDFFNLIGLPTPSTVSSTNQTRETNNFSNFESNNSTKNLDRDIVEIGRVIKKDDSKCEVCSEQAGKHCYYGGKVCPSCRAFFRRAVQNKYYEIFACKTSQNCEINLLTRRSCQFCRFQKCLKAGMKISWVLPDGERNRKFNKLVKSKIRPDSEPLTEEPQSTIPKIISPPQLSLEEAMFLGTLVKDLGHRKMEMLEKYKHFFTKLAFKAYCTKPLTYDLVQMHNAICQEVTVQTISTLEEMSYLEYEDRQQLIKVNTNLLNVFKEACCISEEDYGLNKMLESAVHSGTIDIWAEVEACLKKYNMVGTKPVLKYDQLYVSPWTSSYEEEIHHKKLIWKIKNWLYLPNTSTTVPNGGKPDDVLVVLGLHIVSLNTNFVKLKRRDLVEKAQLRYLKLLRNYLTFKLKDHAKATAKFVEVMRVISYAMEASEILTKRLPF